MSAAEGPATVLTSSTLPFPVDRTSLHALEDRVGEGSAIASCQFGSTVLAVVHDTKEADLERAMVVLRAIGAEWIEEGRYLFWTDCYRVLGRLLDEAIDQIPVDPIDRPSPTLLMPCDAGVEIMYLTAQGVRIARELDEGLDPRFEVYDLSWECFAAAADSEADDEEYWG